MQENWTTFITIVWKVSSKCRVITIPAMIRKIRNIKEGTKLEVRIRKLEEQENGRDKTIEE